MGGKLPKVILRPLKCNHFHGASTVKFNKFRHCCSGLIGHIPVETHHDHDRQATNNGPKPCNGPHFEGNSSCLGGTPVFICQLNPESTFTNQALSSLTRSSATPGRQFWLETCKQRANKRVLGKKTMAPVKGFAEASYRVLRKNSFRSQFDNKRQPPRPQVGRAPC